MMRKDKFYLWMEEAGVCDTGLRQHANTYTMHEFLDRLLYHPQHIMAGSKGWLVVHYRDVLDVVQQENPELLRLLKDVGMYGTYTSFSNLTIFLASHRITSSVDCPEEEPK